LAAVDYRPTRDQPFVLATTLGGIEGIQLKVGSLNVHEILVGLFSMKEKKWENYIVRENVA